MSDVARLGMGIELVGRGPELAVLGSALDRAVAGHPSGLLMSGDAGVGKSRMVAEVVERAAAAGFTVLVGRCLDTADAALPYLPFTEIAGSLAVAHPEVVTDRTALRHLLPGTVAPDATTGEDRALGQLRVFDAMLSALDALSAIAPTLLVVEDLHWADRSSRDLLVFLLSRLTAQRLVVLATYRRDDLHRRHPLRPVLSELVRLPAVERLEVEPLGTEESLELVRRLADGSIDEAKLRRVARRSEGNAFFAEELVSACSDRMPEGLAEVLMARVETLPADAQRVLRIAAVSGRRVRHEQLAAVSGMPEDELEQALRDAVTHHILVADTAPGPTAADGYVFRHALLREAIYHELLPGERTRLHARFAALLAERPEDPGTAAELAYHAFAGHDLPRALAASVAAAREADARAAPAEMLFQLERALELWSVVADARVVAGVSEAELTRWAAWCASHTGDPERGAALGKRALDLSEATDDAVHTSRTARGYSLLLLSLTGRDHEALAAGRQALALVVDGPPSSDVAWAHAALARICWRTDAAAESDEQARAAIAVADAIEPTDDALGAKADALVTMAVYADHVGEPDRGRDLLVEARPLARRSGHLLVELRTHFNTGMSLLEVGRLAEAVAAFAEGEARAGEVGLTWSGYGIDMGVVHVITKFMLGRWDHAETAARIAGRSVSATVATRLTAAGLLVAVAMGRLDDVERRLAELAENPTTDDQVLVYAGVVSVEAALWAGDAALAASRADEALGALAAIEPLHMGSIAIAALGIAAQAELVAAGSDPARAHAGRLAAHAEIVAERGIPRSAELGPEGRAWLARARAELTRITGPDPDAWTAVAEAFAYEGGSPAGPGYREAYALLRRAEAHLSVGDAHESVRDDLRAALATATRLGAAPLAAAVAQLAARAGVRVGEDPAPRSGAELLTPRERSVLGLVAGGRTNRQVGAELYISEKTVSVHLSRVMAKLGASSRTEAVSVAYARGMLAPQDHASAPAAP